MSCDVCKFWKRIEKRKIGHCRRFPPKMKDAEDDIDGFPRTLTDDWCGEFNNSLFL